METPQDVALEQKMKEKGNGTKPVSIKSDGDKTDYSAKTDKATKIEKQPEGGVTLEQALNEEGEGRTPESVKNEGKKPGGLSKMEKATKIMEEMWDDISSGKVKRKDVIKRCPGLPNLYARRSDHSLMKLLPLLYSGMENSQEFVFRHSRCLPNLNRHAFLFPRAGRGALSQQQSTLSRWRITASCTHAPGAGNTSRSLL